MVEKNIPAKTKEDLEREDLAVRYHKVVHGGMMNIRRSILSMGGALKEIRDKNLFLELDYGNFGQYLASPEICLLPASADKYINLFTLWIEKREYTIDDLAGIATGKLEMLNDEKNHKEYIKSARDLAIKDFKKFYYEHAHGVKPDDREIAEYIRKQKTCICSKCPLNDEVNRKKKTCAHRVADELI